MDISSLPLCFYAFLFSFLCRANHNLTPALRSASHRWRDRLHWAVWPIELCGGRIKEQLLFHRSSQLSDVWRPERAKSFKLIWSFLRRQEVGDMSAGIWEEGRVCLCCSFKFCFSRPSSHYSTSYSSSSRGLILGTVVWCSTCCVIWVQWARWESQVSGLAKREYLIKILHVIFGNVSSFLKYFWEWWKNMDELLLLTLSRVH